MTDAEFLRKVFGEPDSREVFDSIIIARGLRIADDLERRAEKQRALDQMRSDAAGPRTNSITRAED